jgi:hypothetical protein
VSLCVFRAPLQQCLPANRAATNISSAQRGLYMLLGGAIFSFSIATQVTPFNFEIFLKWNHSCFVWVIPPMLMNTTSGWNWKYCISTRTSVSVMMALSY